MDDNERKKDLEKILGVLGTEGALDTLLCVRDLEWATASEVSQELDIHVATAVKRLGGLYEIGLLERRVRKGKTRSAQEYALMSNSFGLDIDLEELSGDFSAGPEGNSGYGQLLKDIANRMAKFSGRGIESIYEGWSSRLEDPKNILSGRPKPHAEPKDYADIITGILELESTAYGRMTVRSLLAASLDSVGAGSELRSEIITKFDGGN